MEGHGAYNRSSRVQAAGLLPAVDLLERAARSAALAPPPHTITVADYGSSEGHNSLLPIAVAIRSLTSVKPIPLGYSLLAGSIAGQRAARPQTPDHGRFHSSTGHC
jgi:hypothetical protein